MSSMFMAQTSCFVTGDVKIPRTPRHGNGNPSYFCRFLDSAKIGSISIFSRSWRKVTSLNVQCKSSSQNPRISSPSVPHLDNSRSSELNFGRIQPVEQECESQHKRVFGRFIAREAVLDEEYWIAAWLRAESHWEDQSYVRYIDSYKRKFAEQEFHALKRRCGDHHAEKSSCIIVVKKDEKNVKRTVLNSVVGTLDLSIRPLLHGETFPGERAKASVFSSIYRTDCHRYGYVANVCVAKFARRQGVASNMLYLAIEAAKSSGVEQVFVHVHKDNVSAQQLYTKIGFKVVEMALPHMLAEQNCLLCINTMPFS